MEHQHGTTSIPARTAATTATATAGSQPTIAVVGSSLTGPTVALLFLHAGFDNVTIYEAVPPSALQGGGLIGLEHSSLDILDRLGMGQPEFVKYDSETVMHITVWTATRNGPAGRSTPAATPPGPYCTPPRPGACPPACCTPASGSRAWPTATAAHY